MSSTLNPTLYVQLNFVIESFLLKIGTRHQVGFMSFKPNSCTRFSKQNVTLEPPSKNAKMVIHFVPPWQPVLTGTKWRTLLVDQLWRNKLLQNCYILLFWTRWSLGKRLDLLTYYHGWCWAAVKLNDSCRALLALALLSGVSLLDSSNTWLSLLSLNIVRNSLSTEFNQLYLWLGWALFNWLWCRHPSVRVLWLKGGDMAATKQSLDKKQPYLHLNLYFVDIEAAWRRFL